LPNQPRPNRSTISILPRRSRLLWAMMWMRVAICSSLYWQTATNLVPDDLVDQVALCGPKERIRERLTAWENSPITTMNISTYTIEGIQVMAELVNGVTSATTSVPSANNQTADSTSTSDKANAKDNENMSSDVTPSNVFEEMAKRIAGRDLSNIDAIFQFNISGEEEGSWIVDLKTSPGTVESGQSDAADCTINMADDDFVALALGDLDPTMAFMKGKVKIKGNMGLALKLDKIMK